MLRLLPWKDKVSSSVLPTDGAAVILSKLKLGPESYSGAYRERGFASAERDSTASLTMI